MENDAYYRLNQKLWNTRTDIHKQSKFYDVEAFKQGQSTLDDYALKALGDIQGKDILHLQCHFGLDTLSMIRLGGRVDGVDISEKSIEVARGLAKELQLEATFIRANVLEALPLIKKTYDKVYTSYGVLCWLADLKPWAKLIFNVLKNGGELCLIEFHPVLNMFDHATEKLQYPYFNEGAEVEEETETYTGEALPEKQEYVCWSHSISDVIQALLDVGMTVTNFQELDDSPYDCFPNMKPLENGNFQFSTGKITPPHLFVLKAQKIY